MATQASAESTESKESSFNFIRPTRTRAKAEPAAFPEPERGHTNTNTVSQPIVVKPIPDSVRRRYVQDGRKYYLPSGDRAFVDHGSRLTTKSENTTIVKDLVAVAVARGWSEIAVGGTEAFRRQAWREAKLAGLEVKGYKPSRVEHALLIRTLAGRAGTPEQGDTRSGGADRTDGRTRKKGAREDASLITGKLIDHKADHYQHDPQQEMSYYVRLKTTRGERTVWGIDLERAIRQSLTDVQPGDDIGLRAVERKDFMKKTHKTDETGHRIPVEVEAHRNGWIVEQRRFFNDRKVLAGTFRDNEIKPHEAIRKHPELKGSYLNLKAAELSAKQSIKNPEDRARFTAQVRERMAAAMERGEPLTPVRMRERAPEQSIPDPEQLLAR